MQEVISTGTGFRNHTRKFPGAPNRGNQDFHRKASGALNAERSAEAWTAGKDEAKGSVWRRIPSTRYLPAVDNRSHSRSSEVATKSKGKSVRSLNKAIPFLVSFSCPAHCEPLFLVVSSLDCAPTCRHWPWDGSVMRCFIRD